MQKALIFFACFLAITSCRTDTDYVLSKSWKYRNGYHVGGVLNFDLVYSIKKDTIFFLDTAKAVLVPRLWPSDKNEITIRSLVTNEKGSYELYGEKMKDEIIVEQKSVDNESPPVPPEPAEPK
jgi:hypothetical protein